MLKNNYSQIFHFTLAFVVYFQVAFPKLIPIAILLLLVISIVGYKIGELKFHWKTPLIFLISLYLAYLVGVFFTENPTQAKLYLENKLTFLIFPLLFMYQTKFKYELKNSIIGLVIGVFQVGIIGLLHSINCDHSINGSLACFTSSSFSYIHHPTYFSIYIIIALFASWYGFFTKWKFFSLKWIIPISIIFLAFYTLCLSLAGMLFLVLFIFFLIAKLIQYKFGKIAFFSFLILTPVLTAVIFSTIPKFKVEFNNSISSARKFAKDPKTFMKTFTHYHTGSEERMIMWTVTLYQISKHPFGVGTGNVDYFLQKELKANHQEYLATKNYNPHNQFLQTTLEIGVFGLLILIGVFVFAFKAALKEHNKILLVLIAGFIFNAFFESVLQLQSGIVFFSLWLSLLLVSEVKNQTK